MSLPSQNLVNNSRKAMSLLATRDTPFIFNEWYVAAFGSEVNRELMSRTLLGKRVVLFRTEAGEAIALEDRCAHRSYPLSRGYLDGDVLVCGYHGFGYDTEGNLVNVPSQMNCPRGIGVREYPLIEQGPLLWIWMGDPTMVSVHQPPALDWIEAREWEHSSGYFHHPGNYVSMHENLMDLTHLTFLHANTIGTPDYASAPYELDLRHGHYRLMRNIVPTTLPPVWAETTGLDGCNTAARIATSEFVSPGLHQVSVTFFDSALETQERPEYRIRTAHILTPESNGTMHYFIVHGRDFALGDEAIEAFMHEQLFAAFNEDVEGLGALEAVLGDIDEFTYEVSVASDAPSVAMRRYLKSRADEESKIRMICVA